MIGIDEVGRGCIAGPLLVAAVRQNGSLPKNVKDSKLLTRAQRESLFKLLVRQCKFGEGWVLAAEIDQQGLTGAMQLGVARALRNLGVKRHEKIIIDGPVNYLSKIYKNFECLIDADALLPLVSAASIYAKVRRDHFMTELAKKYANYGFENHAGYCTPQHKLALQHFGPLAAIHRLSFKPLRTTA
ncbi:ribonuclease HII [Candidatus Saccharibacteria bacterium]|nr:ribonuclease HII [Candidatus Saccharibacteria bacterium]